MWWNPVAIYFYGLFTVPLLIVLMCLPGFLEQRRKQLSRWLKGFAKENDKFIFFNKKGAEITRSTRSNISFGGPPGPDRVPGIFQVVYRVSVKGENFLLNKKAGEKLVEALY